MKKLGCPSGYKIKNGKCIPKNWKDLKEGETFHGIFNYKDSHWGKGQTGMSICKNGDFEVSDNRPTFHGGEEHIKSDTSQRYFPTHRSLIDDGCNSAIYSYAYATDDPSGTIWLYPGARGNIEKLKPALKNMNGKYGMTAETKVKDNSSRELLFKLGDL